MVKIVKLIDVAEKAGVSKATASLALNGSDKVNKETVLRVQQAAKELNYIPNAVGQALANKATKAVGLVIPEVNNQFYSEIIQMVKNELQKYEYNLILCTTEYKYEEEKYYLNLFKSGLVDGAIFAFHTEDNKEIINYAKGQAPVVFIDRKIDKKGIIPVIKSDLIEAAERAVGYLLALGHTEIGFLGFEEERYEGYTNSIKKIIDPTKYFYKEIDDIKEIIKRYRKEKLPTAILCYNDDTAFKLIMHLANAGINVPADISVCGIDDVQLARIYNPPLTTVNLLKEKIVHSAVCILIKMIRGEHISKKDYYIKYGTELVTRQSAKRLSQ